MGRTVRLCVAISVSVICLAVLVATVDAKKKPKSRRSKSRVVRTVLPNIFIAPQTNVSTVKVQSGVQASDESANSGAPSTVKGKGLGAPAPDVAAPPPIQAGQAIISEFRLRGPAGAEDEFVELYNNTDSPITVNSLDGSGGWSVVISDGSITGPIFTIPNGTTIPARGHLLGANINGYSLSSYPSGNPIVGGPFATRTPERTWDFDVTDGSGVALFATTNGTNFTAPMRLDAAGFTTSPALFKEGNGIASVVTANLEHTYYRDLRHGTPSDTNDNAADFLLVGTAPGIQVSRLGAPGPENLAAPIVKNSTIATSLVDPLVASTSPPNRTRSFTIEDPNTSLFGTMVIRRKFTNNTGQQVSRLRFRVVEITSLGTPGSECGGAPCADLRALTSSNEQVGITQGLPVVVQGIRLEQPPDQPAGGAMNSSLSADFITLVTPLPNGNSVYINFKLGVMRTGSFRFFVNIEAANGFAPPP
jgi:hypothetical protein